MAGEDVTLRIGGEAEGAKRAAQEAAGAVRDLSQAAGQTAGPVGAAGAAGEEAGKGFDFGRREAARLAQALIYGTGAGGQFGYALTYLIQAALNPAMLAFGAGTVVVMGIVTAFRAMAAETEAEQRRLDALVQTYAEVVAGMEALLRKRGELTEAGAREAREEQLGIAAGAGITQEQARQVQQAAQGKRIEPLELAQAWAGRPAEREEETPEQTARRLWLRGKVRPSRAEELAARKEAARRRREEFPPAQEETLAAVGQAEREAEIWPEEQRVRKLARFAGINAAEAREWMAGRFWTAKKEATARRTMESFARQEGLEIETDVSLWKQITPFGGPAFEQTRFVRGEGMTRYVGMEVHQHFAGPDGRNILADGRPRGPGE